MTTRRLRKEFKFEASHRLEHYDGNCKRLHGHSYSFVVEVRAAVQSDGPHRGMAVDYALIGKAGKDVVARLDHQHLNDVLATDTPTAEFISQWIYEACSDRLGKDLWAVEVKETESTSCRYCPAEEFFGGAS